jgi:glyceraldehyde-3-phosphate dehydrogenase (NADP+)
MFIDLSKFSASNLPAGKPVLHQKEYLINGQILNWSGESTEVKSPIFTVNSFTPQTAMPVCNYTVGSYPKMTSVEALQTLDAAVNAYDKGRGIWPKMTVKQRIEHVVRFAEAMKKEKPTIVELLIWEIAKTAIDAEVEFDRTIKYIYDTIEALKDLEKKSAQLTTENNIIAQIRREHLGVTLCMGPFNYPLNETFTVLIPALIMGNTVIFKPAKLGVLLLQPLLKIFANCFPPGVVNTIYGDGQTVISPLMTSGKIDVLAFIGSSGVANRIRAQHPRLNRLKCILGLDAKNPAIIMDNANIEQAVNECILGALTYNGQRCTALKILFVHERILQSFIDEFNSRLLTIPYGLPWNPYSSSTPYITPLAEPNKVPWLLELIADARKNGSSEILNENGGQFVDSFFLPALIQLKNPNSKLYNCKLYNMEQFGPIIPIVSFSNINEPINYIYDSEFGQQASIFSQNSDHIARIIDAISSQVSRININSQCQRSPDSFPFTGRKNSAEGTLSISDALRVFSIRTLVAAKKNDQNISIIEDIIYKRKSSFLSTDIIL